MDLMNLLRSVEALLYEIVSWLLFYPLTLWRCIVKPIEMMIYAEQELTDPREEQFVDALSPPLFLFLTLVVAHLLQISFGTMTFESDGVLGDERNQLLYRAVLFSLLPLIVGVQRVWQNGLPLNRSTLRPAFYSQCYLAVPFVLAFDVSLVISQRPDAWAKPVAGGLFGAGLVWYIACLTTWFVRHNKASISSALMRSLATLLAASAIFITVAALTALAINTH